MVVLSFLKILEFGSDLCRSSSCGLLLRITITFRNSSLKFLEADFWGGTVKGEPLSRIEFALLPSDELASALMTLIEAIREKVLANAFEFSHTQWIRRFFGVLVFRRSGKPSGPAK